MLSVQEVAYDLNSYSYAKFWYQEVGKIIHMSVHWVNEFFHSLLLHMSKLQWKCYQEKKTQILTFNTHTLSQR